MDFCVLVGCDYAQKLRGVGPKTALKLIVTHKTLETGRLCRAAWCGHEGAQGQGARARGLGLRGRARVFSTEVLKGDPHVSVAFSEPDYEGFRAFLVDTNGFSAERVEAMVKRLRKVRSKKPQRRIDDFVKARALPRRRRILRRNRRRAAGRADRAAQPPSAPIARTTPPASGVDPRTLLP